MAHRSEPLGKDVEPNTAPKPQPYKYHPLNPDRQEIRLFKLAPGDPTAAITGHIYIVSLKKKPTYDALSYVWGECNKQHEILVDTYRLQVGRNLWHALRDIRRKDKAVVLWADAICIDQENTEERGHQVGFMGDIYQNSRYVRAWLDASLSTGDGQTLNKALSRLVDLSAETSPSSSFTKHFLRIRNLMLIVTQVRHQIPPDAHILSEWRQAAKIFENQYWHRLWIQQELLLAKKVTFHLRQTSIPGKRVFRLEEGAYFADKLLRDTVRGRPGRSDQLLLYLPENHGGFLGPVFIGRRLLKQRKSFRASTDTSQTLLQMFMRSGTLQVKDPRDRLYGCLGLVPYREKQSINISYTLTVTQVYAEVIRHFIHTHQTLDFLYHHGEGNRLASVRTPSWLPNPECFPSIDFEKLETIQPKDSPEKLHAAISDDGLVLTVRGTKVDTIASRNKCPLLFTLSFGRAESEIKSVWPEMAALSTSDFWAHKDVLDLLSLPSHSRKPLWTTLNTLLLQGAPDWSTYRPALFRSTVILTETKLVDLVRVRDQDYPPMFGDEIWSIKGCPALFVLRPVPADSYWEPPVSYSVIGGVTSSNLSKQLATRDLATEERIDLV